MYKVPTTADTRAWLGALGMADDFPVDGIQLTVEDDEVTVDVRTQGNLARFIRINNSWVRAEDEHKLRRP